jgi:hypothetical protein
MREARRFETIRRNQKEWHQRCASEMAEIRRGSVQYTLQGFPLESWSSSMKDGTCVDFPLYQFI